MVVLPGPAFVVLPLGLAILATQFLWAKRWLNRVKALLPSGRKLAPAPTGGKAWHQQFFVHGMRVFPESHAGVGKCLRRVVRGHTDNLYPLGQ